MHPHHSEDYKLTAVKYYLSKNEDMRDVCKIFKCSYKSLSRDGLISIKKREM